MGIYEIWMRGESVGYTSLSSPYGCGYWSLFRIAIPAVENTATIATISSTSKWSTQAVRAELVNVLKEIAPVATRTVRVKIDIPKRPTVIFPMVFNIILDYNVVI